ncbi:TetR/AcrR family transcriptional regulator [Nocardia jejuensis]|uniref:TetR/AcrR family transcriptional regulator n=1 Tax=Nocardia jejuensis TaxID=328049 RepID=UPI000833D22A|nr:TetR/AcrR family transcriptional regulator [Nocardia jejuensis]
MDSSAAAHTSDGDAESPDGRLRRGARSRKSVTRRAVDIASAEGLYGLSFGRLADELDLSKAGIQTLFRTKEQLQLATVEEAGLVFLDAVLRPGFEAPAGAARVRSLVEHWLAYAAEPLLPGGCFWTANLADFDSRPGPVRDALARQRQEWVAVLARELRTAVEQHEIADLDPDLAAFQIDAVLNAANISLRLGNPGSVPMVQRVVDGLLAPPATRRRAQRTSKTR